MLLPRYVTSEREAEELSQSKNQSKKANVYGTVIFVPGEPVIDMGCAEWPSKYDKQKVCPRVLLVSTWTDGRWGFVGGGVKTADPSPLHALNREFSEETGYDAKQVFEASDYAFSHVKGDGTTTHVFCHVTRDLLFFQSILAAFHTNFQRPAYSNEIIGICGLPLWLEGPQGGETVDMGKNGCWGLPRMLAGVGGAITQGPFPRMQSNLAREQLLLVLLKCSLLTEDLLDRVVELSRSFTLGPALPTRAELFGLPGVQEILAK